MYCSREYQLTSRFNQQYEKSTSEDFNIAWNKLENSDTISTQEILDMHDLNEHINTQTHKLGNILDWLISNTANTIHNITNKDYLSDHSLIEWKFKISRNPTEKIQTIKKRPNQNQ